MDGQYLLQQISRFHWALLHLFGKRVPANLKIFLLALAIIDDLGAIIVIALFYGNAISWHISGYWPALFMAYSGFAII